MKQLSNLSKGSIAIFMLLIGTTSAFAEVTTTDYDFSTLSEGNLSITTTKVTKSYNQQTFQCTELENAWSGIFSLTSGTWTVSPAGMSTSARLWMAMQNLTAGDKITMTCEGVKTSAYKTSGESGLTSDGSDIYVGTEINSATTYYAAGNTIYLQVGLGKSSGGTLKSITVIHNTSVNYKYLFNEWRTAVANGVSASICSEAKSVIDAADGSTSETTLYNAYAKLHKAMEEEMAKKGNSTFTTSAATIAYAGTEVNCVYGIKMTFGGVDGDEWVYVSGRNGMHNNTTPDVTITDNIPTAGTYVKFEPTVDGILKFNCYLFAEGSACKVELTDGVSTEKVSYAKKSGNKNYTKMFETQLEKDKTYYMYCNNSTYYNNFNGFSFYPNKNLTSSANLKGYKTFYDADITYKADDNTTVYVAAVPSENKVTVTALDTKIIPAKTPVLLKTASSDYKITLSATEDTVVGTPYSGNTLAVTTEAISNIYILAYTTEDGLGFYKYTSSLPVGTVYLPVSSSAKKLSIEFDGNDATGIEGLFSNSSPEGKENMYNLQGVRVNENYKGIVIRNGKKVLMK